jgi:hypothetical protein
MAIEEDLDKGSPTLLLGLLGNWNHRPSVSERVKENEAQTMLPKLVFFGKAFNTSWERTLPKNRPSNQKQLKLLFHTTVNLKVSTEVVEL